MNRLISVLVLLCASVSVAQAQGQKDYLAGGSLDIGYGLDGVFVGGDLLPWQTRSSTGLGIEGKIYYDISDIPGSDDSVIYHELRGKGCLGNEFFCVLGGISKSNFGDNFGNIVTKDLGFKFKLPVQVVDVSFKYIHSSPFNNDDGVDKADSFVGSASWDISQIAPNTGVYIEGGVRRISSSVPNKDDDSRGILNTGIRVLF